MSSSPLCLLVKTYLKTSSNFYPVSSKTFKSFRLRWNRWKNRPNILPTLRTKRSRKTKRRFRRVLGIKRQTIKTKVTIMVTKMGTGIKVAESGIKTLITYNKVIIKALLANGIKTSKETKPKAAMCKGI